MNTTTPNETTVREIACIELAQYGVPAKAAMAATDNAGSDIAYMTLADWHVPEGHARLAVFGVGGFGVNERHLLRRTLRGLGLSAECSRRIAA